MKAKVTIEIELNKDIQKKNMYPNYNINFKTKEEFMQFLIDSLIPNETKSFGYTMKIIKQTKI